MNIYIKYIIESFFDDIDKDISNNNLTNMHEAFFKNYIIKIKSSANTASITINDNLISYDIIPDKETILNLKNDINDIITSLSYMFTDNDSITKLDLSNFNTSDVIDMEDMFSYCYMLKEIDLSNFNTSNVTNMDGMFYNCESLESLDLSSFETSNVTNMYEMFYNCESLESLDLSNFNISNVTNMANMFDGCLNIKHIKCTKEFKDWCFNNQSIILLHYIDNIQWEI